MEDGMCPCMPHSVRATEVSVLIHGFVYPAGWRGAQAPCLAGRPAHSRGTDCFCILHPCALCLQRRRQAPALPRVTSPHSGATLIVWSKALDPGVARANPASGTEERQKAGWL